jgi:protein-L-isoaspartate(D-aspartate) O-methyltransferase
MHPEGTEGAGARRRMVERQLAARGIRSPAVLAAMGRVRRERYVPPELAAHAYEDGPLPIGEDQTISQPFVVAFMLDALELKGGERVLEVGTGSGYAAAVLAEIAAEVFTLERIESLARAAAERLARDGYAHVRVRAGDGTTGWPEAAPFDAIVVAAGGPSVPAALRAQLALGGHLVMPVGESTEIQELKRVTRTGPDEWREEDLGAVRFVPLIGAQGWRLRAPPGSGLPPAAG